MKRTFLSALILWLGCQSPPVPGEPVAPVPTAPDSLQQRLQDSLVQAVNRKKQEARLDSIAAIAQSKTIWGPHRSVVGDFDGDGVQDTLYEKYISLLTGKETNKDYDFRGTSNKEMMEWIDCLFYKQKWIAQKEPLVRLASKNPAIKSFDVESGDCQNGFGYLKNVGDLNGDRTDEIVYYIYDVDMSSMNSCALATYQNGAWKEVRHWNMTENDFLYEEGQPQPSPTYIKKKNGNVYYKEMDFGSGAHIWRRLTTDW